MVNNKTVFVSGASSDIGLVLCRMYGEAKYHVIAHYRTERDELNALGDEFSNVELFHFDFMDTVAFENELQTNRSFFERADIFVNLAASLSDIAYQDVDAEALLSAMRVNVVPGMLLMQVMGPAMSARGWGRIVQASSIGVKFGGGRNSFAYSLSKHTLEFIPSICRTWSEAGVLTNVVRIGVTDTRIHSHLPDKNLRERAAMIPMKRAANPEEIAKTLFWLGSDQNDYVTGQVIAASGGE